MKPAEKLTGSLSLRILSLSTEARDKSQAHHNQNSHEEVKDDDKQAEKFSEFAEKISISYYEGIKSNTNIFSNMNLNFGNLSFE